MATILTFRTMMVRIRYSNAASDNIFMDQGIDTLEEVALLTGEGISDLMKTIWRRGHQIPDPDNDGDMIRALGHLISKLAEENFKLLSYFIRHSVRVSITITLTEIKRPIVISITDICDEERKHTNPDTKPSVLTGNWSKTQDAIREWIHHY